MTGTTFTGPLCVIDTKNNHKLCINVPVSGAAVVSASEGIDVQGINVLRNVIEVSATYSAQATDSVILADATTTAFSVYLDTPSNAAGKTFTIKKINETANNVTVIGNGGNIDGDANQVLTGAERPSISVISDGTEYHII